MKTTHNNKLITKFSDLVFLLFLSSVITACAVEENPNVVRFMFFADDGSNGLEPWASDGTVEGTAQVKDIAQGNGPSVAGTGFMGASEITYWRGRAYFAADDTKEGSELWRSDGTESGTKRFKNINKLASASSSPANFKAYVNWLYFAAKGDGGRELWRTDGSAENTYQFVDINSGAGSSNPSYLTEYDANLYFVADDGAGPAIWKTNGTQAGTGRVLIGTIPIRGEPQNLTVLNNKLCFSSASDPAYGRELWCYSSEAGGSLTRITDINPNNGNADPQFLTVFNGKLYFSANDGSTFGRELWETSGVAGTDAVKISDINPNTASSNPHSLIVYKAALYFGADNGNGVDLWKYTGSVVPEIVQDIDPTPNNSLVSDMKVFSENGQLYFVAHHTDYGNELWVSNGTGASLFKDINPGTADGFKPIP